MARNARLALQGSHWVMRDSFFRDLMSSNMPLPLRAVEAFGPARS
jgi:hypothetical protein